MLNLIKISMLSIYVFYSFKKALTNILNNYILLHDKLQKYFTEYIIQKLENYLHNNKQCDSHDDFSP